jgi:hypothetical protein
MRARDEQAPQHRRKCEELLAQTNPLPLAADAEKHRDGRTFVVAVEQYAISSTQAGFPGSFYKHRCHRDADEHNDGNDGIWKVHTSL